VGLGISVEFPLFFSFITNHRLLFISHSFHRFISFNFIHFSIPMHFLRRGKSISQIGTFSTAFLSFIPIYLSHNIFFSTHFSTNSGQRISCICCLLYDLFVQFTKFIFVFPDSNGYECEGISMAGDLWIEIVGDG
jgi:hypothetical protein